MFRKRFILPVVIIIVVLVVVLTVGKVGPKFSLINKLVSKPAECLTGPLSAIEDNDFVNISSPNENYNFYEQVNVALDNIRKENKDYHLRGLLYDGGYLQGSKNYYFVSVSQKKVVTTDGTHITYSDTNPNASKTGIIEDEKISLLLSPIEAVKIAKPILNCYKDYPENTRREAYLYIDSNPSQVVWKVTVENMFKILAGSAPNVSHSVKINAFTGEVLDYN